jgi:hypothetical protein
MATIAPFAGAAMPKCPACLAVYAGLLGLPSVAPLDAYPNLVAVVVGGSLTASVTALAWRAHERNGYGPALLALLGAIALLVAKLRLDSPSVMAAALVVLAAAAVWNAHHRPGPHARLSCARCSAPEPTREPSLPRSTTHGD